MRKLLIILLLCTSTFGKFQQKPMLGQQVNRAHQLGDFVGAWFMPEGSGNKVFDLSGNGLTGTVHGATWIPGKFGSALSFDEANDYISIADHPKLDFPDGSWSIWIWYKLDNNTGNKFQYVLSRGDLTDTPYFNIYMRETSHVTNPDKWEIEIKDDDGTVVTLISTSALGADSKWHLIGFQRDASVNEIQIWIDGIKDASIADTDFNGINRSDVLEIGRRVDEQIERYWGGIISHLYKYDRALSASEIALLYREPFCMFVKDDIAMMAKAAEAPVEGGQIIFIQMSAIPLFLIPALIFIKRRKRV